MTFWDYLDWFFVLAVFLAAVGLSVLWVFVVRPVRRLMNKIKDFAQIQTKEGFGGRFRNEADLLNHTFQLLVQELRSKEAELDKLYRAAEARARFRERYSDLLLEILPVGVLGLDKEGHIQTVNRIGRELLDWPGDQVFGEPLEAVFGRGSPFSLRIRKALADRLPFYAEEIAFTKKEQRAFFQVSLDFFQAEGGHRGGVVLTFSDMTRLRSLEAQMRITERLAALGTMATGLAHEIRNPLGAIVTSSALLEKKLSKSGEEHQWLQVIQEETRRLSQVLDEFLEFVRGGAQSKEEALDWEDIRDRVLERVMRKARDRKVQFRFRGDWPTGRTPGLDRAGAVQILYNLTLNAVEASPQEGVVTLSASRKGSTLEIAVCDEGPGFSPEEQERIFNPFYSTKANGLGLGLSIVHRLLARVGGELRVESAPSRGSCFRIAMTCLENDENGKKKT